MESDDMMKFYVESRLKENIGRYSGHDLNLSSVMVPVVEEGKPAGAVMTEYIDNAKTEFGRRFLEFVSSQFPKSWSQNTVALWQERLANYFNNASGDMTEEQWQQLESNLMKFHQEVVELCGNDESFSLSSKEFVAKAINTIKYFKDANVKITETFDSLSRNDPESSVKQLDNVANDDVTLVDGGQPFKRTPIDWVDPMADDNFNRQLYEFASANQSLPDAESIPWLVPASYQQPSLLPSDLLTRMTTPLKCGHIDDHEDWEYSVTNPPEIEEQYARFEPTFDRLRMNLEEILTEEIRKQASYVDTTSSFSHADMKSAAKKLKTGETDIDFKSLFILPYDVNLCKIVGVRDDLVGDIVAYKEVVKPPAERIVDKKLRQEPKSWLDPNRTAGPHMRTYGWEPLANMKGDVAQDEVDVTKKRENPDAFGADSELSASDRSRINERIQTLKKSVTERIATKNYSDGLSSCNAEIKDYLERKGQRFGIIPQTFSTPEDLIDSLDMPKLRESGNGSVSMKSEIIPIDPEWAGLDGSGEPHVALVEDQYWKQMESFKRPSAVPSMDWKNIIGQNQRVNEHSNDEEVMKCLDEVTKAHRKKEVQKEPEPSQNRGKDTPARKRQLDKKFVEEWINRFGSDEGIQGLDPKSFKAPEHVVSSEEYEDKYLKHPYTSSYVFHPNFVQFRRMTQNHPTYSEYTFDKLKPPSSLNYGDNLKEFESILALLDEKGPSEKMDDVQPMNERNFQIDPQESKAWDSAFSERMTEGLNMLESFAEKSRKNFIKPDTPCEEEPEDLLFGKVNKIQKADFLVEFQHEPFTHEDFAKLPQLEQTEDVNEEIVTQRSDSSDSSDSDDSEDDDVPPTEVSKTYEWRPFKKFSNYKDVSVLQLLYDASQLLESSVPKRFCPPTRVMEWIEGKYQPSTSRLKKWIKRYNSLFPNVESPLHKPYLFMTDEERLAKLEKQRESVADPNNPFTLTKEKKSALKASKKEAATAGVASETAEEHLQDEKDAERLNNLEKKSGIIIIQSKREDKWAEELNIEVAPDMSTLGTPAMEFPFELDKFQKQAIMALEKGYNVLVSAHTSAGKTAIAEYAIAMSRKRRSRAIYTSPIKALSNQKYNDFKKIFDSVGILTGDVRLNENADCLIMTTEILRSMLYNSSEGIRDLEFVVLDEVHYFNDAERGHVWEEVLILLPNNVQIVMLSATVPNTMEFASWVGRNKKRKVMVCKTLKRPIPLKHYFHVNVKKSKNENNMDNFLIKDGDEPIIRHQWEQIIPMIKEACSAEKVEFRAFFNKLDGERRAKQATRGEKVKMLIQENLALQGECDELEEDDVELRKERIKAFHRKKERNTWVPFIKFLMDIKWMPAIVFVFSRKKCDELAGLLNIEGLTNDEEKKLIAAFIKSQVDKLDDEDRNLPQIKTLSDRLICGIGVHHSGILPVLKEIVEMLFQQGKVKLLIATETFAMGVNMPARTVVYYSIKKFDGNVARYLLPAEYIQMAGRAGRRGDDAVGNVIIKCQLRDAESLGIEDLDRMMTGTPSKLESQFRINYRMILTTLSEGSKISAKGLMDQSYHENLGQQKILEYQDAHRKMANLEKEINQEIENSISSDVQEEYSRAYDAAEDLVKQGDCRLNKVSTKVDVGNFVVFQCGGVVKRIGLILNAKPYRVLTLSKSNAELLERPPKGGDPDRWYKLLSVFVQPSMNKRDDMFDLGLVTYKIEPEHILHVFDKSIPLTEEKAEVLKRNAQLASIENRTESDEDLLDICQKLTTVYSINSYWNEGMTFFVDNCRITGEKLLERDGRALFVERFSMIFKWKEAKIKKALHDQKANERSDSKLYIEYMKKMTILTNLKYIVDDRVQMKGYMAARISKYELVITEMLVRNVLMDLTPEEVVALMSFVVYQSRGSSSKKPVEEVEETPSEDELSNSKLSKAMEDTKRIIKELINEEYKNGIYSDEFGDLDKIFGLSDVMYLWAKQGLFKKIVNIMGEDMQEGMLVRWIQQLVEVLKEIESATRVMGSSDLSKKIQDSIKTIKRGIVFFQSLYTTV